MKLLITIIAMIAILSPIIAAIIEKIKDLQNDKKWMSKRTKIISTIFGVILFVITAGLFYVPADKTGHVTTKIGTNLKAGQIIATGAQKGKQAEVYMPGWNYNILYPWVLDIAMVQDIVVEPGEIVILTSRDGKMNPNIVAPRWNEEVDPLKMTTDFSYFKEHDGTRGVQQYKLTTGVYKINQYWWKTERSNMISIQTGDVLVVESIFGKAPDFIETTDDEILAVPLVESREFRGIVDKSLPAGRYALNPYTEKGITVPVDLQTFVYKGGYTSKTMDISIDPKTDEMIVNEFAEKIPSGGHGDAFAVKTKDNYTVNISLRVMGQVEPKQAARFAGTIKEVKFLDDKIIEPYTKNILLNISVKYTALELKDKREELGKLISETLRKRTQKTGFRTKTIEITGIDIPPIVLAPGKIASASNALKDAMIKKKSAVEEVIKVRNLQKQADNQDILAKAQVNESAAKLDAKTLETLADAKKYQQKQITDAKAYDIEQKAKADNFKIKQSADASKYLAQQIGKDTVGELMKIQEYNKNAKDWKVPNSLTIIGGKDINANSVVGPKIIADALQSK